MPDLTSVIIPCYNTGGYLAESIDSALNQTYPNMEVIVVDDGSTDDSPSIISKYGDRIRTVRQQNQGRAAARNTGLQISKGRLLAFLDADDWWDPSFVSKMASALEGSGAGIAYCGWQNVGLSPEAGGKPFIPPDYESTPEKSENMIRNCCWAMHAAVVRREVVEGAGGFITKYKGCEDFAFWIRAANTSRLVRVPEVLAFYRHYGQRQKKRSTVALSVLRIQSEYLAEHRAIGDQLGSARIRDLTLGELLQRGYICYWDRDLPAARQIFRQVMKGGYGTMKDWKYMLPSLLPIAFHKWLIGRFSR